MVMDTLTDKCLNILLPKIGLKTTSNLHIFSWEKKQNKNKSYFFSSILTSFLCQLISVQHISSMNINLGNRFWNIVRHYKLPSDSIDGNKIKYLIKTTKMLKLRFEQNVQVKPRSYTHVINNLNKKNERMIIHLSYMLLFVLSISRSFKLQVYNHMVTWIPGYLY